MNNWDGGKGWIRDASGNWIQPTSLALQKIDLGVFNAVDLPEGATTLCTPVAGSVIEMALGEGDFVAMDGDARFTVPYTIEWAASQVTWGNILAAGQSVLFVSDGSPLVATMTLGVSNPTQGSLHLYVITDQPA